MPEVNPEILTWARETAGLTREEAVRKLGFRDARKRTAVERLGAYESGQDDPSRSVLVNMAKRYRRPLLTFYLSKIPRMGNRGADFRTLPGDRSVRDDAILDALLRDIQVSQSIVRATLEDEDEVESLSFIGSGSIADGPRVTLTSLENLLNVDIEDYRKQRNANDAFRLLRTSAEQRGIFVLLRSNLGSYQTAIETETFRGFSIADEVAPYVVINDRDARPAWSFTLLHEIVHLILGQTGVSGARAENDIERFCNDVAGEFLLPETELMQLGLGRIKSVEDMAKCIGDFSAERNLSRTMVAYKALRTRQISREFYHQLASNFRNEWLRARAIRNDQTQEPRHIDTYVIRRHRVGSNLINLVRRTMASGAMSTTDAANVLGVKPLQVQKLIESRSRNRN